MPLLSDLSPCGLLECSGEPSEGEKVYGALVAGYTDPITGKPVFDLSAGTHQEAKVYATAIAIACARASLKRSANENDVSKTYDMIPAWEQNFGIPGVPGASPDQRRALIQARAQLLRGARLEAMVDGLSQILGANFIAYRPLTTSEATIWPFDPVTGPGVYGRPDLPAKVVRLLDPIVNTDAPTTASYENWSSAELEVAIQAGDMLCVQSENLGLAERVTVTDSAGTGASRTFTAQFANGHDVGASASTGPAPIWFSSKRFVLIVVASAAAIDVPTRRLVDEYMSRAARAVTQWGIVEPSSPGASTIGPFALGLSPLGAVTVGAIPIVPTSSGVAPTPPPEIHYVNPPTGSGSIASTAVIHGYNFGGATAVSFGVSAATIVSVTTTTITVTTPTPGAIGDVTVSVTTPAGTDSLPDGYTFT